MKIDRLIAQQIRAHRKAGILPIYRLMPISKCWIGYPTQRYVIWWAKRFWRIVRQMMKPLRNVERFTKWLNSEAQNGLKSVLGTIIYPR